MLSDVSFLDNYPTWVRILVVFFTVTTFVLLVFFKNKQVEENHRSAEFLDSLGITPLELEILLLMTEPYELEARSPESIAAKLKTNKINIDHARKKLIEKGLVIDAAMRTNENGPETDLIIISEKGREFLATHNLIE